MNLNFKEQTPLSFLCEEKRCECEPLIVPAGDERGQDVCHPSSEVFCVCRIKSVSASFISAASSPAAVAPPGLNASGNAVTPAGPPSHFFIGLSLTLGFTLMFVVDQVGGYLTSHGVSARPSFSHADCHLHLCISN